MAIIRFSDTIDDCDELCLIERIHVILHRRAAHIKKSCGRGRAASRGRGGAGRGGTDRPR